MCAITEIKGLNKKLGVVCLPCGYILSAYFKATTDKPVGQYFEEKTRRKRPKSKVVFANTQ